MILSINSCLQNLNGDGKNRMRSAGLVVHQRARHATILLPNLHHLLEIWSSLDDHVGEVFHKHASFWMVFQIQLLLWILGEKVADLFVVDFEVRCTNQELLVLTAIHVPEDVGKSPWDDPMQLLRLGGSDHRVGLARTGLAVGKDGAIVAVHNTFNNGISRVLIEVMLYGVLVVHGVESKVFTILCAWSADAHGSVFHIHVDNLFSVVDFLLAAHGPASYDNLDAFSPVISHGL
mmetsp:Transcript_33716/g.77857  ORF Transcript_33716/g.77857 Transcript_33716/m.77857 type:complete len:234 (+) Transcript_33716:1805-2506(+)